GAGISGYVLIYLRPRGQRIERLYGRFDTQLGMTAAGDELLRLDEEFDFADATAPQLDVVPLDRDFIVAAICVDLTLHRMHVGNCGEVEIFTPDKGRQGCEQRLS